ncbi:MAG: glutamate-5-semialdehyde dehydrogenase [Deltaproteobacteria bacterium]|nr:glutamate-5-semialdehyde dehydrogenase [Deltaproteobacteria bacterium]
MGTLRDLVVATRDAARTLANADAATRTVGLEALAARIRESAQTLRDANEIDLKNAEAAGLAPAMIDRLRLTPKVIEQMAVGALQVAALRDPVGEVVDVGVRPNGLRVKKMRIPLGVVLVIYESRPNVTVDAAALCIKSGNAVVLRGGKEAFESNRALAAIIGDSLQAAGLPRAAATFVPTPDRDALADLLTFDELIDVVIPRGGEGLIQFVTERSRIPVLRHAKGVCHVFIDKDADLAMALEICYNSKVERPGVCNACETVLVHKEVAEAFLPAFFGKLSRARVTFRADSRARALVPAMDAAATDDFGREFLALTVAVAVVDDLDAAIAHIARYGSNHTESIVTRNESTARRFQREVASSLVAWNASTRFNDGFELGLGAEIGISTTKLHAFGPMGVSELTAQKWVVDGDGQVRE